MPAADLDLLKNSNKLEVLRKACLGADGWRENAFRDFVTVLKSEGPNGPAIKLIEDFSEVKNSKKVLENLSRRAMDESNYTGALAELKVAKAVEAEGVIKFQHDLAKVKDPITGQMLSATDIDVITNQSVISVKRGKLSSAVPKPGSTESELAGHIRSLTLSTKAGGDYVGKTAKLYVNQAQTFHKKVQDALDAFHQSGDVEVIYLRLD